MSSKKQKRSKVPKFKKFCGSCQHYSWVTADDKTTTCNNLGFLDITPACPVYKLNPFILQDFEKVLMPLSNVLRAMPVTVLPMFYDIIAAEKKLRKLGFYFFEKIVVKYYGTPADKYISNYITARLYSADESGAFIISSTGIRMYVLRDSIIKLEDFLELHEELKNSRKLIDPSITGRTSKKQKEGTVETFDEIIERGNADLELDNRIPKKLRLKGVNKPLSKEKEGAPVKTQISMSATIGRKK